MNILKAILFFGIALVAIGFLSMIFNSVIGSSAWDLVPDGIGKGFVVLIPLILVFGILVITIRKVMGKGDDRSE